MRTRQYLPWVVLLLAFVACKQENTAYVEKTKDAELIHRSLWRVTETIVNDVFSPPVSSRIYAYACIAGYEAAAPGFPGYVSLKGQITGWEGVEAPKDQEICYPMASTEAFLMTAKSLVFSEEMIDSFLTNLHQEFEKMGVPEEVRRHSIEYGDKVAAEVLKWASMDNYKQTRTMPKWNISVNNPAGWRPTPPDFNDALEPHWPKIRPLVMDSAAQFKPDRPTPFSGEKNSQFYKEAQDVVDAVKAVDDERRQIAMYWDDNSFVTNHQGHQMFAVKKVTPNGHWLNITKQICRMKKTGFMETLDIYLHVALGQFDGFISCWDEKYRSDLIRPESYINQYINDNWKPILQTPAFPEYTSGHSVISGASSIILTQYFGENVAFTDSTEVFVGMPTRSFDSFKAAAKEASLSRLYGGIHYMPAINNGISQGENIGNWVLSQVKTRQQ